MNIGVTLDLDQNPWTHARNHTVGAVTHIGRLPRAMQSGASAVYLEAKSQDDKAFIAEVPMSLIAAAIQVFTIRDAIETPRPAHPADTKHSETVGGIADLRFRLADLGTADNGKPCAKYVKVVTRTKEGHADECAFLPTYFTAADLRTSTTTRPTTTRKILLPFARNAILPTIANTTPPTQQPPEQPEAVNFC